MVTVKFSVSATTDSTEFVGIVGNALELGNWRLEGSKILQFNEESSKWSLEVKFENCSSVKYRYFIGDYLHDESDNKTMVVRKWEIGHGDKVRTTDIIPGKSQDVDDGNFGVVNGINIVDQGWLTGQTEVRFNISLTGAKTVVSWHKSFEKNVGENLMILFHPDIENTRVQTRLIKPFKFETLDGGIAVDLPQSGDEVLTFITETVHIDSFSAHFIISDKSRKYLGRASVVGSMLDKSISYLTLAILDNNGKGIGSLKMEYMVITPYKNDEITMENSYGTYWKKRPTIHIGHRGSGNSFTAETTSDLFENTIASFQKAALHSAEMIEFDVQLTKDKIPVVFHDFTICTNVVSKLEQRSGSLHEVEVQSLTFDELQTYATRHRSRKTDTRDPKFHQDDLHPHFRPFPSLQEVFEAVPEHVGFDIELKWPHYHVDKTWYHDVGRYYYDANEFLDSVFDVVFKHGGSRVIMFSCFEANICTMIRRKQNKFPVVYLTNGDSSTDIPFMELRSRYNRLAIPFCSSENFLGLCTGEKDAYSDPTLVEKIHNSGLKFFLYGDNICKPENREILTKQGVDGIIYDRIHNMLPETENKQ
uniref:glycerophosphocholine phosphodiesterase GPCPD1-like n=1 Tax=Styela clava TaxID=7725 RepID=UPI00193ACF12|nr:glycerophosphocholine phosphodiesterase GPCPD1-like [Styela clava]